MASNPTVIMTHSMPDTGILDLAGYEQIKFELADIVRQAATTVSRNHGSAYDPFLEFFARLAEDRFNLVVAGRFSRGKTSLMNAILGTDRLPTGIVPLTSVITSVGYGSAESVQIDWQRGGLPLQIRMDELSTYITERGNPGNTRGIRQASIELPAEILRRGFYFVDTPGLGSSIAENTRTAMGFLPEADALVLVSGYDSPLSEEELRVLQAVANTTIQVFFVLNKQDTVPPDARHEVTEYVSRQLAHIFGDHPPLIFSTSAIDALAAKLGNKPESLAGTGLPELEAELARFLIENKRRHFLLRMLDRASTLIEALPPDAVESSLKERIEKLRGGIAGEGQGRPEPTSLIPSPLLFAPAQMRRCEVCERINTAFFNFLCHFQSDLVNRSDVRTRFVAHDGFCGRHFWLYASLAASRDICVALAPLLSDIAAHLRRGAELEGGSTGASVSLREEAACPLCALQRGIEGAEVSKLNARSVGHKRFITEDIPPLCMPHLQSLSPRLDSHAFRSALYASQAQGAERLAEDMRRYALKRDGLRRGLTSDEETSAAKDAIAYLAGHRSIAR
jgi:GTP-binding protein EngB required for normal cell division